MEEIEYMENTQYMEAICAQRALLMDEDSYLEGCNTISLETQDELVKKDILTYIQDNFANFMRQLRFLSKEDQELLLSYYLLNKTQNTLALIHKSTQTICSFRIRMAEKKIGCYMMLGVPTVEVMSEILTKAGFENSLDKESSDEKAVVLSKVVDAYAKTRNFQRVAEIYHLHRPDIRRAMSRASKALMKSKNGQELALGAFLHGLIDKASASGQGFSKRKLAKICHVYRTDPAILGAFRVSASDPHLDDILVARANH